MLTISRSPSTPAGGLFSPHARIGQPSSIYNSGNDDIENINRFSFPNVSFSPSYPSASSMLSPRSPFAAVASSPRGVGGLLSPLSNSPRSTNNSGSGSSGSPLSSPLPPLSPRGVKFIYAVRSGEKQNKFRMIEKRRKASDATASIMRTDTPAASAPAIVLPSGHNRKVSFKLFGECTDLPGLSLPASLPSSAGATVGSASSSSNGSPVEIRLSSSQDIIRETDSLPTSPFVDDGR